MGQTRSTFFLATASAGTLLLGGCFLKPAGMEDEQQRLDAAGAVFEQPYEERVLPELGERPEWRHVLHRAFYANGDLEAAYFEWKAAMQRIPQAATWPNNNLRVSFEYMFSAERMKAWDRTTVRADVEDSDFPTKVAQAGRVALSEARVVGERFRAAKFDLQREVLLAWIDYALMAEQIRIQQENLDLLRLVTDTAANRVRAGAQQQDLLKAQIAQQLAENELRAMQARLPQLRAMLNAMLGRDTDNLLPPPDRVPLQRIVPADDARLLAIGVDQNPELAALARDAQGRRDALELARMRYIPDVNPMAGFTGSLSQFIGAMVMLPTALPAIKGAINEARAELQRTEAMIRQTRRDTAADYVATLYALRDAERQAELFEQTILPAAELLLANSRQAYTAGTVEFVELIDSQRTLLDVREMIAEAQAMRERALVRLEALAGVDIETLAAPATRPAAEGEPPSTQPLRPQDQEPGNREENNTEPDDTRSNS